MTISPCSNFQGARDPVSKSPLIRRLPMALQAVGLGSNEVPIVVDVVESKVLDVGDAVKFIALVVVKAVGEAAILALITE
jgi:hypothetical protein